MTSEWPDQPAGAEVPSGIDTRAAAPDVEAQEAEPMTAPEEASPANGDAGAGERPAEEERRTTERKCDWPDAYEPCPRCENVRVKGDACSHCEERRTVQRRQGERRDRRMAPDEQVWRAAIARMETVERGPDRRIATEDRRTPPKEK